MKALRFGPGGRNYIARVLGCSRNTVSKGASEVSGWRTREFDAWIGPRRAPDALDVQAAQERLGEELVVLPIATLDWVWLEREGGAGLDPSPRYGPLGNPPRPVRPAPK